MKKIFALLSFLLLLSVCTQSFASINNERILAGDIKRAYIYYKDADEVYIKTGYGDCGGKYWEIESDITYSFGTIAATSNPIVYYIYIDDSAATYPSLNAASFTHSTTAPTWSDDKQGWYNTDDRCIGAVLINSEEEIQPFEATADCKMYFTTMLQTGSNMTSDDTWRYPGIDTDNVTPINTKSIFYYAATQSTGPTWVRIGSASSNFANQRGGFSYGTSVGRSSWIDVSPGGDRTMGVCGYSSNSSVTNAWLKGWQIER